MTRSCSLLLLTVLLRSSGRVPADSDPRHTCPPGQASTDPPLTGTAQPLWLHCPPLYGRGARGPAPALQGRLCRCRSLRDRRLARPGPTEVLHPDRCEAGVYCCRKSPAAARLRGHVTCEGRSMVLRCRPPRELRVHAAVFGRRLGRADLCPSPRAGPEPAFECLNHEARGLVSGSCSGRPNCTVAVSNRTFRDPCSPGTRKYLSVSYSCVPRTLMEVDPGLPPTPPPTVSPGPGERVTQGRPDPPGDMMSDSLQTFAFLRERSETAALLFTSSVCVGLVVTLLAVSVRVSCRVRQAGSATEDDTAEETSDSLISTADRKQACDWEEVTYVSEAAERAERVERRDMILQEIWMNSHLHDGS